MKAYHGWYIVAISACVLALSVGGPMQAFGLFVLPASEAFGLSRAQVNTGAILLNLGMAAMAPVVGKLIDTGSIRVVMAVSAVLLGASLVCLGLSHSILLSAAAMAIPLAAATVGSGTVTSPTLVARWFDHYRGRAMALALGGIAVGPMVVVPAIGLLMEAFGWRASLILSGVILGVLLMLLAVLVRERPGPGDMERGPDTLPTVEQGPPLEPIAMLRMLRMRQFWTIALGVACAYGIMQALIVSLVPFGQGKGLSIVQSASLISMYGGTSLAGSLVFAWLGDRFNRLVSLVTIVAFFGVATATLLLAANYAAILVCVAFIGIVSGAITPAFLALLGDCFGAASFGTASGLATFISTVVSAATIRFGGEVFDRTGNYDLMLEAFFVAAILAAGLVALTPRDRRDVA